MDMYEALGIDFRELGGFVVPDDKREEVQARVAQKAQELKQEWERFPYDLDHPK